MKRISLLFGLIILAGGAAGQEKELDLNDLVTRALERNPGIKAHEDASQAAKFSIKPAGALPDPVIGFGIKNMSTHWTVGEEVMSEVDLSFSQTFPFPGKQRLKSEIANTQFLQTEENYRAARLTLVREIKDLYAKLYYYQRAADFLRQKKDVLEKALKLAELKYSVGTAAQPDIFRAQVEISGIEDMLLNMSQMIRTTSAKINALLDLPAESPLGLAREIPLYTLQADLETLSKKAEENSPRLQEARLMIEQGEIEVQMAKKEFYPNFMVELGKGFKGPIPDMYEFMVGVEIPLWSGKKQSPLLEQAVCRLSSTRNDYASMRNQVGFMVTESYTMAKTSGSLAALYKDKILPQARFAYESSLANYQTGKVDFLMLISDITNLFTYEAEYVRNLSSLWSSAARLEELTELELINPAPAAPITAAGGAAVAGGPSAPRSKIDEGGRALIKSNAAGKEE
jgi:outer membrane protein, heavy metal efflux system